MSGRADKFERITHDNVINNNSMRIFENKTFLSFKSWNVYAEISNLIATTIMGATRIVTRDRFNCKLVQEIVDEYDVNVLQLTSYQIQQMRPATVTGNYFENLERVLCTGPKISESLIQFAAVCFPNSALTPHLIHAAANYSPPGTPEGLDTPPPSPVNRKSKPGFLKGLFRKKTKSVGI